MILSTAWKVSASLRISSAYIIKVCGSSWLKIPAGSLFLWEIHGRCVVNEYFISEALSYRIQIRIYSCFQGRFSFFFFWYKWGTKVRRIKTPKVSMSRGILSRDQKLTKWTQIFGYFSFSFLKVFYVLSEDKTKPQEVKS